MKFITLDFLRSFGLRLYFNPDANLEIDFKVIVQNSYWNINLELLIQILVLVCSFAVTFNEICLPSQTCSSHTKIISSFLEGKYHQAQGSWWILLSERGITASRTLVFKHS